MASVETKKVLQDLRKKYDNNVRGFNCQSVFCWLLPLSFSRLALSVEPGILSGPQSVTGYSFV